MLIRLGRHEGHDRADNGSERNVPRRAAQNIPKARHIYRSKQALAVARLSVVAREANAAELIPTSSIDSGLG
jgi:hypothetical protein